MFKFKNWITFISICTFFFIFGCQKYQKVVVVLCAGDSITNSSYPQYLEQKLLSQKIKAKVYNFGRNGNNSGQYLKFLILNKDWLKERYPDFILLQLGTNDVRVDTDFTPTEKFYQNIKKIISIFREFKNHEGENSKIILSTIPPLPPKLEFPFTEKSRERVEKEINPAIRKIAEEESLYLIDNFSLFKKNPKLLQDIHPNEEGYKALAENWFTELKKFIK